MSVEVFRNDATVVQRVVRALQSVPAGHEAPAQRLALMYAEAIDDADEVDALFRFGPKLRTCLASVGLSLPVDPPRQSIDRAIQPRLAA